MTLPTWRDNDIEGGLAGRRVAVIGYGAQGRAQALNLRDRGVDVVVGLREGSESWRRASDDGLAVANIAGSVAGADFIALLVPDEHHGRLYAERIDAHAAEGSCLVFAHGFSITYGLLRPRGDLDVVLVAPKGAGFQVRDNFLAGAGVPALIAVERDASGDAKARALAYAGALGCGRAGVMETTFRDETETDLFGEQVVLCGGVPALVRQAFEVLVDAGYPPELAYFECLHELKLTCDLMQSRGIAGMSTAISNTAEFGAVVTGPRIIDAHVRRRMGRVLKHIRGGTFARRFMREAEAGFPDLQRRRDADAGHGIEAVGRRLRALMPWLGK